MSEPSEAAENIYRAMLDAQRDADDIALCDALDLLCERTGQNKFRFAASVIRGTKLGRHAIDDRASLRRIAALREARGCEAVSIVAREVAGANAGDERVEAIAQRLRRKLREKETNELVKFAATGS
jgi:hypothetical protein